MEVKWLEDFLSLTRTGNFSQSARERNVTQPAFSRRIKALETWLGVTLIDRSTYPTRLTACGEVFLPTAELLLKQLYRAQARFRSGEFSTQDVLSFAAQHSLALGFFPKWLKTLHREVGPFSSRLVANNFHDCVQCLIECNCDFLLCFAHQGVPYLLDSDRFPSVLLSNDRLVPVTSLDPGGQPKFRLTSNSGQVVNYLSYAPDSFLGAAVDLILQRKEDAALLLDTRYESSLAEAVKVMVLEGHGVAWIPESAINHELATGQLAYAADASWTLPLEVRLYASAGRHGPLPETLWAYVNGQNAARSVQHAKTG